MQRRRVPREGRPCCASNSLRRGCKWARWACNCPAGAAAAWACAREEVEEQGATFKTKHFCFYFFSYLFGTRSKFPPSSPPFAALLPAAPARCSVAGTATLLRCLARAPCAWSLWTSAAPSCPRRAWRATTSWAWRTSTAWSWRAPAPARWPAPPATSSWRSRSTTRWSRPGRRRTTCWTWPLASRPRAWPSPRPLLHCAPSLHTHTSPCSRARTPPHAPFFTRSSRLGCQVRLTMDLDGARVRLPAATRNMYVDGFVPKPH